MVKRSDENLGNHEASFSFNEDELVGFSNKKVFTGKVSKSKRAAECAALEMRLQGRTAFVQNGLEGKYEVVASEYEPEVRQLTADFKEVGAGIWQATNPDWDSGSLWTLYSSGPDGVLISRLDDEEVSQGSLSQELMIESSVQGLAKAATVVHHVGEVLSYVDPFGNIVEGKILEVDHSAGGYWIRNAITLVPDFIPMHSAATEFDHMQDDELTVQGEFEDGEDDAFMNAGFEEFEHAGSEMDHMQDDELTIQGSDGDDDEESDYSVLFDDGKGAQDWEVESLLGDDESEELDVFYSLDDLLDDGDAAIEDLIDDHEEMV